MIHDIRDSAYHEVIDPEARLSTIAGGFALTEGPVWSKAENCLYFSELVSSTVYRWSTGSGLAVFRRPSNITNGNTIDRQGRLVSCEHATSVVSRLEEGGRHMRVLASHFGDRELNSPNDIVCDSQDRIWFTDPAYGRTHARVGVLREVPQPVCGVYRLDPDGTLNRVIEDFDTPNGLCFLPGEDVLLVNDTARMHIRRFDLRADGSLGGGEVFATTTGEGEGKPDGMKADTLGRVYCTGPGGVHVFSPQGTLLGIIRMPEQCRNFCFGGPDHRTMFFACSSAILRLDVRAQGLPTPAA
jgi:gluconolactonase